MLSRIGSKYGGLSSTTSSLSAGTGVLGVEVDGDWNGGGGTEDCSLSVSSSLHRRQRDFTFSGFVTIGLGHDSDGTLYGPSETEFVDVVASPVSLLLGFPVSDS